MGLDWSILSLVEVAQARNAKLWFLCDDDTLNLGELLGLIRFLQTSKSAVNICNFVFEGEDLPKTPVGRKKFRAGDKADYFRASFLPTLAIDANSINTAALRPLCGTNYIHIALVNTLITNYSDLNVYLPVVGIQSANNTLTFSLRDTFLRGYVQCLSWRSLLSTRDIKQEARDRCKGYIGVMIKGQFASERSLVHPLEVFKIGVDITQILGVLSLILLFPRLLILLLLSVIR